MFSCSDSPGKTGCDDWFSPAHYSCTPHLGSIQKMDPTQHRASFEQLSGKKEPLALVSPFKRGLFTKKRLNLKAKAPSSGKTPAVPWVSNLVSGKVPEIRDTRVGSLAP